MDDSSESKFWPFLSKLFSGRNEAPLEKTIVEAMEDGEVKPDDMAMLLNVLRLGRKRVEEIIIPRTDIVCAEIDDGFDAIVSLIIESGHSRIPIYRETRDNIIGIVHAKDLLKIQHGNSNVDVKELMRKPFFIPETKNIKDLLQEFRTRKIHLAIALDEYGGTSGLVTFEDVLEEIVGEIEDEYDAPRPADIQQLENGTILVSGRTMLEDILAYVPLDIDSTQVETIGGYLCEHVGRVPVQDEEFVLSGARFHIKEADPKQVRWIVVEPASALN